MTDEYSDLLKKATSLKKSNLDEAIILIERALKVYVPNYHNEMQAIKKLAEYLVLNNQIQKSIQTLIDYIQQYLDSKNFYMRVMNISILLSKLNSVLKKKLEIKILEDFSTEISFYASSIQGRLENIKENKNVLSKNIENDLEYLNSHGKKFITDIDEFNNAWMNEKKLIQIYDNLTKKIKSKLSEVSQETL